MSKATPRRSNSSTPGCLSSKPRCVPATPLSSPPTTAATLRFPAPTTRASTCLCWSPGRRCAPAWISGCARRFPTSARRWPPISAHRSQTAPASYGKFYEKTNHGGQLEDVQDARGNHAILREIPAAGREIRTLRDRDLSSFHESRRGRRRRQGKPGSHWLAKHSLEIGRAHV